MRQTSKATVAKERTLRRDLSPPEARLWQYLRTRPAGFKFRRQHPAGPFILDFYCPLARLAIEIDGEAHGMGGRPDRDLRRDAWLEREGFSVLRIPAAEVRENFEGAVLLIMERCAGRG
ncbi:MAG: endonuclease domain-containing protein [Allosphingosinicella sp.]|uniref:endonuclease domain-containing protein n=1 Tax=Allosphingosinicella sp. TaxID=2823234 RepID=UPI003939EE8B